MSDALTVEERLADGSGRRDHLHVVFGNLRTWARRENGGAHALFGRRDPEHERVAESVAESADGVLRHGDRLIALNPDVGVREFQLYVLFLSHRIAFGASVGRHRHMRFGFIALDQQAAVPFPLEGGVDQEMSAPCAGRRELFDEDVASRAIVGHEGAVIA